MTVYAAQKSPGITQVVHDLRERLGADAFHVVDHWEDDGEAIGIASPRNYGVLAYISICGEEDGKYYVALELPPKAADAFPYTPAGESESVDFETLVRTIVEHFGPKAEHKGFT